MAEGALRSLGAVGAARPNERVDLMRGGVGSPYAAPSGFQSGPAPAYAGQTGAYQAGPALRDGLLPVRPVLARPVVRQPGTRRALLRRPSSAARRTRRVRRTRPGPGYQSGPQQPAAAATSSPQQPGRQPAQPPRRRRRTHLGADRHGAARRHRHHPGTSRPADPSHPGPSHPGRRRVRAVGGTRRRQADRTAPLWPSSGPPASRARTRRPRIGPRPTAAARRRAHRHVAGARRGGARATAPAGDEPIPDQVPVRAATAARPRRARCRPLPTSTDDEDGDFDFPDEDFPEAAAGVIWAGNVPTPPPQASAPAPPRQPTQPSEPRREPTSPAGRPEPGAPAAGRAGRHTHALGDLDHGDLGIEQRSPGRGQILGLEGRCLPPVRPRARAACRPARVRPRRTPRSNSARAAKV